MRHGIAFCASAVLFVLALTPALTIASPATLWELKGDHNRIFLLGSMHLLRPSDYPIPALIYDAYDEAETLIMELDMDDLDPRQSQALVQELGMNAPGESLQSRLGNETYVEAHAMANELGISLNSFAQLEPWLAAISIETIMITRVGFQVSKGIESHLMTKAVRDHKEITGLETERQQFNMLDSLSADAQRELLMQTLAEGAGLESVLDGIIDDWRHGDIAALEDTLLGDIVKYEELHKTIIVDRNRDWVGQIEALLDDDDDYLIIVGTAHLLGETGVPRLLRERGHDVRQMQ